MNIENLAGVATSTDVLRGGTEFQIVVGRVAANGTCQADFAVGASGEDIIARIYEFSGETPKTTLSAVFENGAGTTDTAAGTSTTIGDAPVVTHAADRLAVALVALESAQATANFTGETGGDWTEAVSEFVGTTMTLQLQIAAMSSASTIDGGSFTVGVSTPFLTIGTAIIPSTDLRSQHLDYDYSR